MNLNLGERGVVVAFGEFLFTIIMISIVWIVFNEFILGIGQYAISSGSDYGYTIIILIIMWRATPIVFLLASVMAAILRAHKGEDRLNI